MYYYLTKNTMTIDNTIESSALDIQYTTNIYMNIGLVLTIILNAMFDIIGSLHSHGMVPSTTAAHERRSLSR